LEENKMADTKRRSMLNTTINGDIMNDFRDYCKSINCPMNTILEAFMTQFANGDFTFKLTKNKKMTLDIED
jgi:hypothetical protein